MPLLRAFNADEKNKCQVKKNVKKDPFEENVFVGLYYMNFFPHVSFFFLFVSIVILKSF